MAHGIEPPAERRAAGKPEQGTVEVSATVADGELCLRVADDGRGIDRDKVAARARELDVAADGADLLQLVSTPGLSTAPAAGMLAGRGAGLDAVVHAAADLGGTLALENRPGQGVTVELRLPLAPASDAGCGR